MQCMYIEYNLDHILHSGICDPNCIQYIKIGLSNLENVFLNLLYITLLYIDDSNIYCQISTKLLIKYLFLINIEIEIFK